MSDSIFALDREHVFRAWVAQSNQSPMVIAGGEGAWFWDEQGNRYLDFCSQRVNLSLGHQHPRLIAAIQKQAAKLSTVSQIFATEPRSDAARLIAERAPKGLNKVFFTNSGADAVEHAVRMAKVCSGRHKVFSMHRSYHGSTAGALSLTGDPRRWPVEPGLPGGIRFHGPYLYRSSFAAQTEPEECARALAHLEELLMFENPESVAAIILEPIIGSNGLIVPPSGYLAGVRALCDRHGILMICDEVMSGFGRTGEWFSVNLWGVVPDLITFAKGVNSGYVPLGGVAISDKVADYFSTHPFPGGGTYYGHPLACAVAAESIRVFEQENILSRVRQLGTEVIGPGLRDLASRHPVIGEVRGVGCFWALELVKSRETREALVPYNGSGAQNKPMKEIEEACKARGLFVLTTQNRLFVCPPLVTSAEDVQHGLGIIDEVLRSADRHVVGK